MNESLQTSPETNFRFNYLFIYLLIYFADRCTSSFLDLVNNPEVFGTAFVFEYAI